MTATPPEVLDPQLTPANSEPRSANSVPGGANTTAEASNTTAGGLT